MSFATRVSSMKHRHRMGTLLGSGLALTLALSLAPGALRAQGPTQTLPISARTRGVATAPVTVYEMADFQCPVCRRFVTEYWPTLQKEFVATGKVKWIYIMYPLTSIHANAAAAATFAACAGAEGKFWPTHDMLFATQESWEKLRDPAPFFQSKVAKLGLKSDVMNSCLQSGAGTAMVKDDADGAERSGARGTPTFYIEGGLMDRLYPLEVFEHILDSVWKAKSKKS